MGGGRFWWEYLVRKHLFDITVCMFLFRVSSRGMKEANKPRATFFLAKERVKMGWSADKCRRTTIKLSPEKTQYAARAHKTEHFIGAESCQQSDGLRKRYNVLNPLARVRVLLHHVLQGGSGPVSAVQEVTRLSNPSGPLQRNLLQG